jgi:hypothetical protein
MRQFFIERRWAPARMAATAFAAVMISSIAFQGETLLAALPDAIALAGGFALGTWGYFELGRAADKDRTKQKS